MIWLIRVVITKISKKKKSLLLLIKVIKILYCLLEVQ